VQVSPNSNTAGYGYDPGNKRMYRGEPSQGIDEIDFWGVTGQKLGAYQISVSGSTLHFGLTTTNVYFGGKLVSRGAPGGSHQDGIQLTAVTTDRLGSIGKFYPYGQEKPSATTNDTQKFTGYYRDAVTGLDYADQRYHEPGMGRFATPDPYKASSGPQDPGSWNKYAYTRGDPVNRVDPNGQDDSDFDFVDWDGCGMACQGQNTWNNLGYYAGVWAQGAVCQALISAYAGDGGAWNPACGGVPTTPVAQQPTCSISLWERPTPTASSPGWHTYISATEYNPSTGTTTTTDFEGGPQPTWAFIGGKLTGTIAPPGFGLNAGGNDATGPGLPSNIEVGAPYRGANACSDITLLNNWVTSYNNGRKVTYNFTGRGGYNSNSFTFTLDSQLGLLKYFGQPGGLLLPGWDKRVPGL